VSVHFDKLKGKFIHNPPFGLGQGVADEERPLRSLAELYNRQGPEVFFATVAQVAAEAGLLDNPGNIRHCPHCNAVTP
jgi:hypothetical protein